MIHGVTVSVAPTPSIPSGRLPFKVPAHPKKNLCDYELRNRKAKNSKVILKVPKYIKHFLIKK